ncbi:MAG: Asp-tRNA(Asn)/Glu-tRNA(Gln) amidotransferase subunit GatB, partial [Bacteroidota bacterium]
MTYETIIGLEVHVQLDTQSKAFSPDPVQFGAAPNTLVDAISLGHPGTLPVLNGEVVEAAVKAGLALNCSIREHSTLSRKHYFYPDLPKGYQISQYEDPICYDGHLDIKDDEGSTFRVGITRIHIEEDAGKLMHDRDPLESVVDLNRCGTPLLEIVSEPDLRSARQAFHYLRVLRQIVRYLGIGDGNMEEGSFRCDANVSVRPVGTQTLGTKTELKNMNSFRNVERAIEFEAARHVAVLRAGGTIVQETRLWDGQSGETRSMRSKESAPDYRYLPDPDLVPVVVPAGRVDAVRSAMPELPARRLARYMEALGLSAYDAGVLTEEIDVAEYFESVLEALGISKISVTPAVAKLVANLMTSEVLRTVNERGVPVDELSVEPERLAGLARLRLSDAVSSSAATTLFDAMIDDPAEPEELAQTLNLIQVSDAGALVPAVEAALASS